MTEPEQTRAERFARLYAAHADRVHALCFRLGGSRDRALDLAQDVFLRVWERLDLLRDETGAAAWIRRVALNTALNALRGERRRLARVEPVAEPAVHEHVTPRTPLPVRRMDLEAALARLPARARAVLVLHDIEGYSDLEIGAELGIARGTVRAHLHRARTLMREMLS